MSENPLGLIGELLKKSSEKKPAKINLESLLLDSTQGFGSLVLFLYLLGILTENAPLSNMVDGFSEPLNLGLSTLVPLVLNILSAIELIAKGKSASKLEKTETICITSTSAFTVIRGALKGAVELGRDNLTMTSLLESGALNMTEATNIILVLTLISTGIYTLLNVGQVGKDFGSIIEWVGLKMYEGALLLEDFGNGSGDRLKKRETTTKGWMKGIRNIGASAWAFDLLANNIEFINRPEFIGPWVLPAIFGLTHIEVPLEVITGVVKLAALGVNLSGQALYGIGDSMQNKVNGR